MQVKMAPQNTMQVKMTPQNTIQVTEYSLNKNSIAFGDLSDVDMTAAQTGMVPVLQANGTWTASSDLNSVVVNGGFF